MFYALKRRVWRRWRFLQASLQVSLLLRKSPLKRNLWLLAIAQGLFLTNNVTFIAINGLVGLSLAPLGWMATLPVMGYVVGGALSTGLVAKSQTRFGRKTSFQLGLLVGLLSAAVCAYAAYSRQFWLLVAATVVAGFYNANAQLYRFAASELANAAFKEKAVSLVLAGGLIGAVLGPNLALWTKSMFATPFAGAYLALVFVALLSMLVLSFINFPAHVVKSKADSAKSAGRPLSAIMRQPVFIVSTMAAPPTRLGMMKPRRVMMGRSALRSACLVITRKPDSPLALAVCT